MFPSPDLFSQSSSQYKYVARRKKLVELLKQKGITSEITLNAIGEIPRERFMSSTLAELAYDDKAYPIAAGQTISQPFTVAKQTSLLQLQGGEKVLEIGTGSGYQAAVLHQCGCHVYSIERQKELYDRTSQLLQSLNFTHIHCKFGDGFEGWEENAPFDRLIVTAGCSEIPQKLLMQLKTGGIAIIPMSDHNTLRMLRITRISDREFSKEDFGECAFVPMLRGTNS